MQKAGALTLQAAGLVGFSQMAPKLQLPVALQAAAPQPAAAAQPGVAVGPAAPPATQSTKFKARCPVDFTVDIEQGGFVVLSQRFVSGAISGPGYLRVLYADDDLRIFESPRDSPRLPESPRAPGRPASAPYVTSVRRNLALPNRAPP